MHFGFDDDQLALRDAVRDLLTKECPPEVVRAAWQTPPGELDRRVWTALADMGVFSMLVPEAGGGLGLDERSLVLVLEETGYAALPHPVVETAAVAIPLVTESTTLGLTELTDTTLDSPSGRALTSSVITSNLGGPNVPCAEDADALLYLYPDGNGAPALHLATVSERHALDPQDVVRDRFTFEPLDTVDRARRAARVTCPLGAGSGPGHHFVPTDWAPSNRARFWLPDDRFRSQNPAEAGLSTVGEGDGLADEAVAVDPLVALAFDRGALGTAAQLVGLGQRMLDMTVTYVSERQQFGQPVGAFQAVKHHLADALKELAFARPAVHRAAHSIATGAPTRSRDVSMAKAMASDAASFVGRQALQCHGAIGYTTEADLHLYLKRTWALASAWGSPSWHRARVATHIVPS